ncbi:50S ribosomal protein L14e [Candidatus Woesearchaeota archaeon]|nr:50S ribosomal protein L14e [Candidatus Woesearchaeota archaeon]
MIEVGRVCLKIAGRDAGLKCVVVDVLDNFVLIDGQTRRRKCNPVHLEPLDQKLDIEKGASHEQVVSAFKELKIKIVDRKPKAKAPSVKSEKPVAKPVEKVEKPKRKPVVKKAPEKKEV